MTKERLNEIRKRNELRKGAKHRASPGPWYVQMLDDDQAMNLVGVTTEFDPVRYSRWPDYPVGKVVALTLVQSPRYADIEDGLWDENAQFIAFARNDSPEEDIDALLSEIERLRSVG